MREFHRRPGSRPSEIAEVTGLQRSNVSTAVRSLQAGGLVVRERATENARAVRRVPTDLASESVARIHAYWATILDRVPREILAPGVAASPALARIANSLDVD